MGTQVNAKSSQNLGVFWSNGAWFCYAICSPWKVAERDEDGNGEPSSIDKSSFIEAAKILPKKLSTFKRMVYSDKIYTECQRDWLVSFFDLKQIDGRDYNEVRRFILKMAKQKLSASIG